MLNGADVVAAVVFASVFFFFFRERRQGGAGRQDVGEAVVAVCVRRRDAPVSEHER